jgi:hypothetical protein
MVKLSMHQSLDICCLEMEIKKVKKWNSRKIKDKMKKTYNYKYLHNFKKEGVNSKLYQPWIWLK